MGAAFLQSELLAGADVLHGFSLRGGGVSAPPFDSLNLGRAVGDDPEAVAENHRRLARAVGYDVERLVEVDQVHGADGVVVDGDEAPTAFRGRRADALVARPHSAVAVAVRTADCVPVLMAHPESGAVAAVHVGWRGAVAGVLPRAVDRLVDVAGASSAEELLVAIGPHIHLDAFEVGEDVASKLAGVAPGAVVVRRSDPRPHADLGGVCRAQLRARGLEDGAIEQVGGCTFADPTHCFSHRRDGGRSGRHLAVVVAGPSLPTAA